MSEEEQVAKILNYRALGAARKKVAEARQHLDKAHRDLEGLHADERADRHTLDALGRAGDRLEALDLFLQAVLGEGGQ